MKLSNDSTNRSGRTVANAWRVAQADFTAVIRMVVVHVFPVSRGELNRRRLFVGCDKDKRGSDYERLPFVGNVARGDPGISVLRHCFGRGWPILMDLDERVRLCRQTVANYS